MLEELFAWWPYTVLQVSTIRYSLMSFRIIWVSWSRHGSWLSTFIRWFQFPRRFLDLLQSFNLIQNVSCGTHNAGHTLDLVITRSGENFASSFEVSDPGISDHLAVKCKLQFTKVAPQKKRVSYRNLRSVSVDNFCADLQNSALLKSADAGWTLMSYFPVTIGHLRHCWILMLPWNVGWSLIVLACHGLLQKLGKQRGNVDNWNGDGAEGGPRRITDCMLPSVGWSTIWLRLP